MRSYQVYTNERGVLCGEIDGVTIHSLRNPVRESGNQVESIIPEDAQGVIIFGTGLGYIQRYLREHRSECAIIVLEPDPLWLEELNTQGLDYTSWSDEHIVLTNDWRPTITSHIIKKYPLLMPAVFQRLYAQEAEELKELFLKVLDRRQVNKNTLKRFGKRWVSNLLSNFHFTDQSLGINRFIGQFSGLPALLLAGGPSLSVILDRLPALRERMIILAVDTAYPPCRAAGVEPDFLVSVDPQYWNTKHIEQPGQLPKGSEPAILVSESSTHPRIFRQLNNRRVFSQSLFPLGKYLEEDFEARIPLGSGGSVATSAWDFLRISGCSEVYCIGLDMGFPGRQTHFSGSYFEQTMAFTGSRLNPSEQSAAVYLYSGQLSPHPDHADGTVLSDRRMDVYCSWFEQQIRERRKPETFNLNQGARRINGIKYQSIEKLMNMPILRTEIDSQVSTAMNNAQINAPENGLKNALNEVQISNGIDSKKLGALRIDKLYSYLHRLEKQCRTALDLIEAAGDAPGNDRTEILSSLDRLDEEILSGEDRQIAGFLISDITDSIEHEGDAGSFSQALERSATLYQSLNESCKTQISLINRHYYRFKN